jgi:hypothetical protein
MIKIEHNASTGEITEKTLSKAEVTILEKQRTEVQTKITEFENQVTMKLELLNKLGITEAEAKSLLA